MDSWDNQWDASEHETTNGLGYYRDYEHGSIYCRSLANFGGQAVVIYGLIRQLWASMGKENSPQGFPITDEVPAGNAGGG